MNSTDSTMASHSSAPWSYEYNPYTRSTIARDGGDDADTEIPAFEICDAEGDKIFDTNENTPQDLQEANARLAAAAPELLLALIECARLLADFDESDGEEGLIYRQAVAIIEQATSTTDLQKV